MSCHIMCILHNVIGPPPLCMMTQDLRRGSIVRTVYGSGACPLEFPRLRPDPSCPMGPNPRTLEPLTDNLVPSNEGDGIKREATVEGRLGL